MSAARAGRKQDHGPIPKLQNTGRRRMDRQAERRLIALKKWRAERAVDVAMDPGVLCPNSALEAIAWRDPEHARDLEDLGELKRWFVREFGSEVTAVSRSGDETAADSKGGGT
jgi:ribonuclease D